MPSPRSVPCIRVDLLDSSPRSLSSSSTLDIRDILRQVKVLPNLLTEGFASDDADDADLYSRGGHLQDVRPFPVDRRPQFFVLHSGSTRLPFHHKRLEAFGLGDLSWDEGDTRPLLTAPTIPRMKLIMRERLYVKKWIGTLTSHNPPRHIPWACEKSAAEREWIAEGSMLPVAVVKPFTKRRAVTQGQSPATDTNRLLGFANRTPHSGGLRTFSEGSVPIHLPTDSHTPSHVLAKSADVDLGVLRQESKTSQTPHRIVRASHAFVPSTLLSPEPPAGTTAVKHSAPLAARRGKSLSDLKLKRTVIEELEYPDIPTAFLGSSGVLSPQFDASAVPTFTDHENMLLDLRSRCAALGNGTSTCIQEPLHPRTDMTRTSPSVDEWAFARGLATFDDNFNASELNGGRSAREILVDSTIFLPDDSSTPTRSHSSTTYLEFAPRLHSTPTPQLPTKNSCGPPVDPLPPRPALVSPSTPPHVRGILKKVKSVRFEDMISTESRNDISPVYPPQSPPEHPLLPPLAVSRERPCTPIPTTAKPSSGPAPIKQTLVPGRNVQDRKPAPRPRLPPRQTKMNEKLEPVDANVVNAPASSKPTLATASVERPCRIAHVKENTNPVAVAQVQTKQRGSSIAETDVRRGLEGPTKSRVSVPLRNIFRFK